MRFDMNALRAVLGAMGSVDEIRAQARAVAADLANRAGVADFLEIPAGDAFNLAPADALAYFRQKGLRATFDYRDMIGEAHDHAFTVAKMMDVDMLAQVRASLDSAMANGTSFKSWAKELEPVLKAGGWWGEADMVDPLTGQTVRATLGTPWRLETIFRTNMQQAYAVEAWREIEENAEAAPYLMYDAVDDFRTREQHRRWDRTVLPVSHPWWRSHFPPLGFNCRCGAIQLSAEELQQMGVSPTEAPEDGTYRWRNPRTEMTYTVPDGVDPGFDHNPGESFMAQARRLLDEKIRQLPADMIDAAQAGVQSTPMQSTAGRAAAIVVDLAGDVQTAAKVNAIMSGPLVGYIEARIVGAAPTAEQIAAFAALSQADQREVERMIALGA